MSEINKDRKPTKVDREVLAFLESGGFVSHIEVLNKFGSTQSRDIFWRLRKAGYPIKDEMIYKHKDGKVVSKFKIYYITKPLILPSGYKTEALKAKNSLPAITRRIAEIGQEAANRHTVQTQLF